MGKGTYKSAGVTYTVMLAPAGRYLASGPSAYLFDERSRFVDWTADMGDFYTVKNRFDLASGHVQNITKLQNLQGNPDITGERHLISELDVQEILKALAAIPGIGQYVFSIRVISANEVEVTTGIIRDPEERGKGEIVTIRREKDGWRCPNDGGILLWRE